MIIQYLRGTPDLILCYHGGDLRLKGYSDADWGGDRDERRSTSGKKKVKDVVAMAAVAEKARYRVHASSIPVVMLFGVFGLVDKDFILALFDLQSKEEECKMWCRANPNCDTAVVNNYCCSYSRQLFIQDVGEIDCDAMPLITDAVSR
ncbi:hypothetical protein RJ640_020439 [Escallonia rubra]|uniref:Uncharacterized protein n=1 Tax=Escallonia rubra TaxID=112253 RepID=A0AA88RNG4_9ASTE|nr:hypothetical protein RJ640_020439 [Escallonia rubra]